MRVRHQASIGATIFGAFVVMGLLTAAVLLAVATVMGEASRLADEPDSFI